MNDRVLVVGGGRFVGWHLVEHLRARGMAVDVLNRGQTRSVDSLPPGVVHRRANRQDAGSVRSALHGQRYGAVFDTSGYVPSDVMNVLRAVQTDRYVYVSTLVVYDALMPGRGQEAPITEHDATIDSTAHAASGDDYAADKRACETLLLEQSDVRATVVRPCGIYGVGDYWYRHDYFFDRISSLRPIMVPSGYVGRTIHLTSVAGLAEVCLLAALTELPGHRVYNVADRDPITCDGLAELCSDVAGRETQVSAYSESLIPSHGIGARAAFPFGPEPSFRLDLASVQRDLGWTPSDLRTGTSELWEEYQRRRHLGQVPPADFSLDDLVSASATPVKTR